MKRIYIFCSTIISTIIISCNYSNKLYYALESAGSNRNELVKVLEHYKNDSLKYAAACFLIENMPGHYSYLGTEIDNYYDEALNLFCSDLPVAVQRDSLLKLSETKYAGISNKIIQDVKIISSQFLIYNIDKAFYVWENAPWAQHLNFDQFCEWILPYKCSEYQKFDYWRDTLSKAFTDDIARISYNDETCNSPFKAVNTIREEIIRKVKPVGMFRKSGYPMLSASTLKNMTFGRCLDYVNLGVLTYRSMGIPAIIDETPIWGRYRAGHNWYVILDEKGDELKSEWDISSVPGSTFFPYQRIPKVYRNTYSPNIERIKYIKESMYQYPFNIFQQDITDKYYSVTDVEIKLNNVKTVEKYAYIAVFSGHSIDWKIVDFGHIKKNKVYFSNMGRNILYVAFVYDGKDLIAVSNPFIIYSNGNIDFVNPNPDIRYNLTIKRKYYSSENVVNMRNRILGGCIQASNDINFNHHDTILVLKTTDIPDKIGVNTTKSYRYWRYCSPNGSYGNIAELTFFTSDTLRVDGQTISNMEIKNASKAFDDDWLSFSESESADNNWVGLDMGVKKNISFVRIVPRNDDNDIHPGDEYHLRMWDGYMWITINKKKAYDNYLEYNNIIDGCLYSIHNATRGWDERPFVYRNGKFEWW